MELEAIIGLEIHIEMKTNSKMFSSAPVFHNKEPNTMVGIIDFAFPGTLPTINKQTIIDAIRVGNALNMEISHIITFDRKNYFYSDLPKGYQITQHFNPICKNGYLQIELNGSKKRIGIERLHIEEDTCKQFHLDNQTLLDYNRAGIPLIEIVSKPDINNEDEAVNFIEKIRSIVSLLNVSDGKMEDGSLRCDINISLKSLDSKLYGTKVEIKNLNSFSNIKKAIKFEIDRQTKIINSGLSVKQETRRFDEKSKQTVSMRNKHDAEDYKYIIDPNLPPILLSSDFIDDVIKTSPELAEHKQARYEKLGLDDYDISIILANKEISCYFDETIKCGANPKIVANWIIGEVQSCLNNENISINKFGIPPLYLGKLVLLVERNIISNNQAREIFATIKDTGQDPEVLIKELGLEQLSDSDELLALIVKLLDSNPNLIRDYKNGKDRVLDYFLGQIMKLTQGKANPSLTRKLLIEEIKRR